MSVKCLPSEIIADLDPRKRVNLASSLLRTISMFINLCLLSFDAPGKPNISFASSTRAKSLNGTRRGEFKHDSLVSSHCFERVSKTTPYSNHINNYELETRPFFLWGNIQTKNILMTRQTDFVTPLHHNPYTRSTAIF